jgi:phage tail-like protein
MSSASPPLLLQPAPASATARGYLREGLPAVYLDLDDPRAGEPFAARWMTGLEEVLDPIVTLVDNLAWHLDPRLAPEPLVRMLLSWLGLIAAVDLPIDGARRVLMRAESVAARRGTLRGLREVLTLAFPDLEFELRQEARFTVGDDPAVCPDAPPAELTVSYWRRDAPADHSPLAPGVELAVDGLVDMRLPVAAVAVLVGPDRLPVAR